MKKIKNIVLLLLLFLAAGTFFYTAGKLLYEYLEYQKGADVYEEFQGYVRKPSGPEKRPREDADEPEYLIVDFDGLRAQNPDIVAWLQIPALEVSYPVAQGADNDHYLHYMFNGEPGKDGTVFVDCHNSADLSDPNTIIYGHNMRDGSMFGTLDHYQDSELYKKYPYFYIYVPGYVLKYHVMSCYAGLVGGVGYTYYFPEDKDFQQFLDCICSYSGYDTGVKAGTMDKVVTLSTCVNDVRGYRFLVHGKFAGKLHLEE